jgi:predicted nicotinamide N-methyase
VTEFDDFMQKSDLDAGETFFELANQDAIRFRLESGRHIQVKQDPSVKGTGGIVWETSFLLARYLQQPGQRSLKGLKVLEVGAGCGLLGLSLADAGCEVVMSDHPSAMANLSDNTNCNRSAIAAPGTISAQQLDWTLAEDIAAVSNSGPFDLIVGTDVVFNQVS